MARWAPPSACMCGSTFPVLSSLLGGEINFLLGELRAHRTPQPSTSARTRINNLNEAA